MATCVSCHCSLLTNIIHILNFFYKPTFIFLPTAASSSAAAAVLAEERADRPGGVGAEGGAVVDGPAGGDEEVVVRGDQERLQDEVGRGADDGVDQKPAEDDDEGEFRGRFHSRASIRFARFARFLHFARSIYDSALWP